MEYTRRGFLKKFFERKELPKNNKNKENEEKTKQEKREITRRWFLIHSGGILAYLAYLLSVLPLKGSQLIKQEEEKKEKLNNSDVLEIEPEIPFEPTPYPPPESPSPIPSTPTPTQTPTPTATPTATSTPKPTPTPILTPTPEVSLQTTTKVIYYGPRKTKRVAITFDDTANPELLRKLLEFAKEKKVKMVWFVVGKTVNEEAAQIIKEALESGFIRLGNHTINHKISLFGSLNNLEEVKKEKEDWMKKMREIGIKENELKYYFRPPGGGGGYRGGDPRLLKILSENKYEYLVMWDIEFIYTTRTKELPYNVETIYSLMYGGITHTQGGNIVLCHFNMVDIEATIRAIEKLIKDGYQFVFPEELFN